MYQSWLLYSVDYRDSFFFFFLVGEKGWKEEPGTSHSSLLGPILLIRLLPPLSLWLQQNVLVPCL